MIGFPIINLYAQLPLINTYIEVHYLGQEDILAWLRCYGRVNESILAQGTVRYAFFSNFGFEDAFYFVAENKIAILPVR